jgi:pantoate--beta-alanine ligase
MGSKDYQQCMVVQRLLTLMRLPTTLHRCPIVRETDGLAMSSRNVRLDPEQRRRATAIYKALQTIREAWPAPVDRLVKKATEILEAVHFRIDYVSIAQSDTLLPYDGPGKAVALIAAFMGEVRLIDNLEL